MNLDRLRTETRPEHEATETVMPLMNASLTMDEYASVLQRLYRLVQSWEQWAQAHVPDDLAGVIQGRQRAELLRQDLLWTRTPPTTQPLAFETSAIPGLVLNSPTFRSTFLGAMYVMEGSTLGGQYIARHLEEKFGTHAGEGAAYFRGYGERTGEMWRAFKAVLAALPDEDSDGVITAANAMFRWFRLGMTA